MSEKEKKIIEELADKLPVMSERERGYLEGKRFPPGPLFQKSA